ncbi:MAG TPA: alpha/beta hydrolase [Gemmatimonadaceae bacterium]|jgi:pimeloyl-ACP methyl ester carboxylesterase
MSAYDRFIAFRKSLPRTPKLEKQTVKARGVSFAVFSSAPVAGTLPLLCVNGGMLYDHSMLWPALSPLAATRQVILYDQRGRGASTAPANPSESSIEDDAADIAALRRALGIRRWDVFGHSWGGGISMLAVAGDVAGVRKLVMADPVWNTSNWMAPLRRNVIDRLQGEQRAAVERISEESLGNPDPVLHNAYAQAVYPSWFADADMASHFVPPVALSETGTATLARLRRDGYDWRPLTSGVSVPTLVIHGDADPLPLETPQQPLTVSRSSSYIGIDAHVVVVPSGHMPFWEAPERFFELVNSFL